MNNRGKIRYVFASSNTSRGFYTFIPELITGLKKVYILKGAVGSGKSTFIRLLSDSMLEQGYEVELWISAADGVIPDGVYIPQLEAAVVNGSLPLPIDPRYPGAREIIINLGEYGDKDLIGKHCHEIAELIAKFHYHDRQVGSTLKSAVQIKESIKMVSSDHLNIEKMEQLIKKLSAEILTGRSREKHYFASAVTAEGMINYVDEISGDCHKRYIFRGPSGSGKSTVINEVANLAKQHGYLMEYYHCGLDPESLVMVIIRNLQLALIDDGQVEIAVKPWDVVINMEEYLDNYNEELADTQISELNRSLETFMLQAQKELENTSRVIKEIKKIYSPAMNFTMIDNKRNEIREEISRKE